MPDVKSQVQDGLLVVRLTAESDRMKIALLGELDLGNAKTAEGLLFEALGSEQDVLVDLGKLEFLDSTGIALLVTAMQIKQSGLAFIPSESAEVRRLLSLTGLDERMEFLAGEEPPTLPAA